MTLDDFFAELDQYRTRVPLRLLDERLRQVEIDLAEIEPFIRFGADTYRRNLLRAGPAYHALILCWRSGQRSPIHDHRGSSCGVRVLRGTATETVFERTPDGHIFPTRTRRLEAGFCCGTEDQDIHQLSNLEPAGSDLITLHIYSPPLLVMGTYSLTSTRVNEFTDRVYEFCEGAGI
ncbi:MAG: cysteine dioxygenase family protein [Phycisphaerae bacterium]|nr:cysteine dioxygenase family protein [Phycisphaerae bacterium]MDW8261319.1 cysteine dioxygenase family protein [Phycisphaerales bacterium]